MIRAAALALLPCLVSAAAVGDVSHEAPRMEPLPPIDRAVWEPRTGDLILRASTDVVGDRIRAASGSDAVFSHVGMVVMRAGRPAVIDVSPFGSGVVEFTDIARFTTDPATTDLLVLRPAAAFDARRLETEADRLARARVGFDYDFDMADRSEIYCAELAYHLLAVAGMDLSSVRWTDIYMPFAGERRLVTPDALAHIAGMTPVTRRRQPS
jgi:hypothetical protein